MPSACDPTSFTAVRGKSRSTIQELSSGFVAGGLYFSSDLRGSYLVAESIVTNAPTEVVTGTCWYDAAIVLGPKGPDGQATVINDEILSIRYDLTLFLENGQWRVGAQLEKQQLGNGNLCPPAS